MCWPPVSFPRYLPYVCFLSARADLQLKESEEEEEEKEDNDASDGEKNTRFSGLLLEKYGKCILCLSFFLMSFSRRVRFCEIGCFRGHHTRAISLLFKMVHLVCSLAVVAAVFFVFLQFFYAQIQIIRLAYSI